MISTPFGRLDAQPGPTSPTGTLVSGMDRADPDVTSAGPVFLPSEVLAGRFRVIRPLGGGGMGEVYEVEDFELGGRVAIKTLRSSLRSSDSALALFRNEIQLARRVTHTNVCRTFDVFRHRRSCPGAEGGMETVFFLTMELVEGETLAHRLRRRGPLSLGEAMPVVEQVASALTAAHAAGIVHRDLKAGNVMLGHGGRRAVVTDFGLASAVEEAGGRPCGTVPYRAPEQEAGEEVGPAADVYALGVLVHEILTGGHGALPVRSHTPAPPGGGSRCSLPPGVAPILARCLARRPKDRPPRARDVYLALLRVHRMDSSRRRRLWVAALAACLALAPLVYLATSRPAESVGPGTVLRAVQPAPTTPAATGAGAMPVGLVPVTFPPAGTAHPHLRVAVIATDPAGKREGQACGACDAVVLEEFLAHELSGSGIDLAIAKTVAGYPAPFRSLLMEGPALARAAMTLGVDFVTRVTVGPRPVPAGAPAGAGDGIVLTIRLVRTGDGAVLAEAGAPGGDLTALEEVARQLASVLERYTAPAARHDADTTRGADRLGADPAALRHYADGSVALHAGDAAVAVDLLSRSVALEPGVYRYRMRYARALLDLERRAEAVEAAEAAREIGRSLGQEEQLAAEALLHEIRVEPAAAVAAFDRLAALHPEQSWYDLAAATSLHLAGRPQAALLRLDQLERRRPEAVHDPRLWLRRQTIHYAQESYGPALAAARRAIQAAEAMGSRPLLFEGLVRHYHTLRLQGRLTEAMSEVQRALDLGREAANPRWERLALRHLGVVQVQRGEIGAARSAFEESLTMSRRADDADNTLWCLNNLAVLDFWRGDLATAESRYAEALALLRVQGHREGTLMLRGNLAILWFEQGRLDRAEQEAREVVAEAEGMPANVPRSADAARLALVWVALERGDLEAAGRALDTLEAAMGKDQWGLRAAYRIQRSSWHRLRGEPAAALDNAEGAVAAARSLGRPRLEMRALRALGEAQLAAGDPASARRSFTRALAQSGAETWLVLKADIQHGLGLAELQGGDPASARRWLSRALAIHDRAGIELRAAHDRLALARLHWGSGDTAAAGRLVERALETYQRLGDRDHESRARDLAGRLSSESTGPTRLMGVP